MADRLSILIVNYNTCDLLRQCLISIRENPPSIDYEVIVIDNLSSDGSAEMVEQDHPEVRLIRRKDNPGYGVAVNDGVTYTTGNLLMFLNPDMEVYPGALNTLVEFVKSHPQTGVVGPKLVLPNGEVQNSARPEASFVRVLFEASRLHWLLPRRLRERFLLSQYFSQSRTLRPGWICGACHLIPRSVWDQVGPLTEETFCGSDDYDYCYRTWKAGYEVWLCSEATMTHHGSVAIRKRWSPWEVEQISIHNTFVVLSSHWPPWRVRLYAFAECVSNYSELIRNSIVLRPGMRDLDEPYHIRIRKRIQLLRNIASGKQQPIRRYQQPKATEGSTSL